MKKYAKIIDSKTYEVQIGVGNSDEYYESIGMTLMDVEQAYNGLWYVAGHTPQKQEPTEEELKQMIRSECDRYLQYYDFTQLSDAPFTSEEKLQYVQYRQYLRDYTKTADWWKSEPKTFDDWHKDIDNILD